jgi:HAE1 family hydrophobic/amphiphilic exporter-1
MATLAVGIFGFVAARNLPVELLPDLSYPTLTVQTVYPDAAPVSVEQFVTKPVEEAVGVIPGVRSLRSVSRAGTSEVVLEFDWDEEMDIAALAVREKLGLVELPREAEKPRVLRFDPSLDPVMRLALSGERSLDDLRQLAERVVGPRLEAVRGVAAARVRGGLDPEIAVEADEDRLAALGLTLEDLAKALRATNVNQPGGTLRDFGSVYLVRTMHELDDLDEIRATVLRETPQGRVRVEDVATVVRGHRDRDEITRSDGKETVEIDLHREGDANTVTVSRAARAEIDELEDELPEDLRLALLTDQARYIGASISQVWSNGIVGGLLAILVLYFFLRSPAPTLVIALTIPTSVLATFLAMRAFDVSLNIMSLGGLALGVGNLVDNSIVVLEAIERRRGEAGASRGAAAMKGAMDVAGAVTASTLTTVAVFLPITFVEGVAGQLFRDLAVTVCVSQVASLVTGLTLMPALAGLEWGTLGRAVERPAPGAGDTALRSFRLFGLELPPLHDGGTRRGRVLGAVFLPVRVLLLIVLAALGAAWSLCTRAFDVATAPLTRTATAAFEAYPRALRTALRRPATLLLVGVGLFVLALLATPLLGTHLVPELAQGEFSFQLQMPEGTTLQATNEVVEQVERQLGGSARFARVFSIVGSLPSTASGRQTLGEHLAQVTFVLPDGARRRDEVEAVAAVRQALERFPRLESELVRPSVLALRAPVEVHVVADDLEVLDEGATVVEAALRALPGVEDVVTTREPGSPEVKVELDRDRASALGVSPEVVSLALRRQIRGEIVGQFREAENRFDIRLRSSEDARGRASEIGSLRLKLPDGTMVPVSAVAEVEVSRGPAAIHRAAGARVVRILGQTSVASLGALLDDVRATLFGLRLPAGVTVEMAGQDADLAVSQASLRLMLALAAFLVYAVMAMQFESLVHPLVIMLSLPQGIVGVVGALLFTDTAVDVLVLIGVILLSGIVVNNAIVLLDATNRRRREGEALEPALVASASERIRPILMTTLTTLLGLLPMALGLGEGAELRRPLAITVIGGLAASTLLTLFLIPCAYLVVSRRLPARAVERPDAEGASALAP